MSSNAEHFCMCIRPEARTQVTGTKGALLNEYRWLDGARITARFLGGDKRLQQRVEDVANEWVGENMANLFLTFLPMGARQSDLRIAFQAGHGSWSYLGTYCRGIPEPEPTMNFGWIDANSPDTELRSVVLHEFGHALGLIHEHQSPIDGGIKWNRDAVIADLRGPPNNWDLATIEHNIFKRYDPTELTATSVDRQSIMMYPIPAAWTLDGFSAGFNSELSDDDKAIIRATYP
jgi:serralysin